MDRRLLVCAAGLLGLTSLGLSLLSFERVRKVLRRLRVKPVCACRVDGASAQRIVAAVERAAQYLPLKSTCLGKALAAQVLLDWHDLESHLRVGVMKTSAEELVAHDWLESGEKVLIGDLEDLSQYTRLPRL